MSWGMGHGQVTHIVGLNIRMSLVTAEQALQVAHEFSSFSKGVHVAHFSQLS